MRIARVSNDALRKLVWESLYRRMNPATRLVIPSWRTMMRETRVCRQRIADVAKYFTERGWIRRVEIPKEDGKLVDCYYELQVDRHDADIASARAEGNLV